jgi:hypothetical protein
MRSSRASGRGAVAVRHPEGAEYASGAGAKERDSVVVQPSSELAWAEAHAAKPATNMVNDGRTMKLRLVQVDPLWLLVRFVIMVAPLDGLDARPMACLTAIVH